MKQDPEFAKLYERFGELLEEEYERTDEVAPDLPPENDEGNREYKLQLTNLSLFKVKKRKTQMGFRIRVSSVNER